MTTGLESVTVAANCPRCDEADATIENGAYRCVACGTRYTIPKQFSGTMEVMRKKASQVAPTKSNDLSWAGVFFVFMIVWFCSFVGLAIFFTIFFAVIGAGSFQTILRIAFFSWPGFATVWFVIQLVKSFVGSDEIEGPKEKEA